MCTCLLGFNGDGRNCTGKGLSIVIDSLWLSEILVWVCLFVCFDKAINLAWHFWPTAENENPWSHLNAREQNAEHLCWRRQESWLKAFHFSDIDERSVNLSCRVNANCTKLAQVILISFLQSQLFKAESNLKRPFNSNRGGRRSQTFILKCSSTP